MLAGHQKPVLKQEALRLGLALAALLIVGLMTTADQTKTPPAIAKATDNAASANSTISKVDEWAHEQKIASKKSKSGPRTHRKTRSPVAMATPRSSR